MRVTTTPSTSTESDPAGRRRPPRLSVADSCLLLEILGPVLGFSARRVLDSLPRRHRPVPRRLHPEAPAGPRPGPRSAPPPGPGWRPPRGDTGPTGSLERAQSLRAALIERQAWRIGRSWELSRWRRAGGTKGLTACHERLETLHGAGSGAGRGSSRSLVPQLAPVLGRSGVTRPARLESLTKGPVTDLVRTQHII